MYELTILCNDMGTQTFNYLSRITCVRHLLTVIQYIVIL